MKKLFFPLLLAAIILTGCASSSPNSYLGLMAGAEIGGTLGEAIGFMSTSRHDGPGKAMLGSVVGTVAGAAIGYTIANEADQQAEAKRRTSTPTTTTQTSGGYDVWTEEEPVLSISAPSYQDEDGDGKLSRYETINIIYEVTNHSTETQRVELIVSCPEMPDDIALSPSNIADIEPGHTIRYKAKALLNKKTKASSVTIICAANSATQGSVQTSLRVPIAD